MKGFKDGLCMEVPSSLLTTGHYSFVSRLLLTPVKIHKERDGGRAAKIDKPRLWVKFRDIYRSSLKCWSSDYGM